jgi:hypothetical protein
MSEDGVSEGAITKAELAELADLFDKFEFAFDPISTSAKEAESRFEDRIREIFEQKVVPAYPQLGFSIFCCKVRSLCRKYLKRNAP